MLTLREYQERSLDALQAYLRDAATIGARRAFVVHTDRAYREVPQLPGLPYVCLRVPTGGGKTVMAAHAVGLVARDLLQADSAVCLWLVPSNTIRDQTLKALRDRSHPYRQALQSRVGGDVQVMDLAEAHSVTRSNLTNATCVIVSTLAALRVEDTDGRKIYEESGALMPHFSGLTPAQEGRLESGPAGRPIYSLANALGLHRPIVVMDEAHNARTALSFDTLARFAPSCIVEFTATPELTHLPERGRFASNVLHHVSAAELKAEEMVKLPIRLFTRPDWKETLGDAVAKQRELEALAAKEEKTTGEYLRPIVLMQAQAKSKGRETLVPETVKKALIEDCKVPAEQIAIATGETREIDDVDLMARDCPIRFVVTVQALREGWDCPFAYILCSLAESNSARAVEQVLGRVLRMPYARRKNAPDLNCAYAYAASAKFGEVVKSLQDALVESLGFERIEAEDLVVPPVQEKLPDPGPLFSRVSQEVTQKPDLSALPPKLAERVVYDEPSKQVIVYGVLGEGDLAPLQGCFRKETDKAAMVALLKKSVGASAKTAKAVAPIKVPLLGRRVHGDLLQFDEEVLHEGEWNIATCDPALTEAEFASAAATATEGTIDVTDRGKLEIATIREMQEQLALMIGEKGWTVPGFANWLDRHFQHPDIPQAQSSLFIQRAVEKLIESRGATLAQLARRKFDLLKALVAKIDLHRRAAHKTAFDAYLFGDLKKQVEVDPALCLTIEPDKYAPNWLYEGGFRFQKHAFPRIGELKADGEEFECAQFLDAHPKIEIWVRNISGRALTSFWLQTSTDRAYPDFVARLTDGRILAVEYKNATDWSNDDSKEKRAVGALWADRSGGRCRYVMPKGKTDLASIDLAIR